MEDDKHVVWVRFLCSASSCAVLYFTLKGALIFNNLSAPISDSGVATVLKGIWQSLNYIINYSYMFTLVTKWK